MALLSGWQVGAALIGWGRCVAAVPTLIEAVTDQAIFAPHFRDAMSWRAWWTFGKALFALPMEQDELAIFQTCTARTETPLQRASEAVLVVGRRGGKSRFLALVAAYLAAFVDWAPFLAPGEKGFLVIVAADRRQCRTILNYVRAFLALTDLLRDLIIRDGAEEIELSNGLVIEVATCSYRTIRGRTVIVALCDENAFWADDDGANPATEVLASLRPAMATVPGAMLLIASSPYWKRGPLWDAFRRWYGKSGGPLVWHAPTWIMNPHLPQDSAVIQEAYERDEASAKAEYGAEFRNDVDGYVTREVVEACVEQGRVMLPPLSGIRYRGFADPSGGSADSFTLGIAHSEGSNPKCEVLDAVFERKPPFSPEGVVAEYADHLKRYGISMVTGDRYAGEWPREQFCKHGISYSPSAKPKSDIYRELLPLLNSGTAELLDNQRLINQLVSLERRVARSGKDSIDHAPGGHDDVVNAAAGALITPSRSTYTLDSL